MQLRQESLAGGTGPHTSWRNRSLGGTGVPIPLREAHLRTGRDIHTNPSSVVALRIKEAAAPIGRILVCRRRCPVVATHRIGRETRRARHLYILLLRRRPGRQTIVARLGTQRALGLSGAYPNCWRRRVARDGRAPRYGCVPQFPR